MSRRAIVIDLDESKGGQGTSRPTYEMGGGDEDDDDSTASTSALAAPDTFTLKDVNSRSNLVEMEASPPLRSAIDIGQRARLYLGGGPHTNEGLSHTNNSSQSSLGLISNGGASTADMIPLMPMGASLKGKMPNGKGRTRPLHYNTTV